MTKLHCPLPPPQSPRLPVQLLVLSSATQVMVLPPGERCSCLRLCKTRLVILASHRVGDTGCAGARVPAGVCPQRTQNIPLGASVCCIRAKTWEEKQNGSLFNLAKGIVLAVLNSLMCVLVSQPFCLCGLFVSHQFLRTEPRAAHTCCGCVPSLAPSVLLSLEVTTCSSEVHCHFKAMAKYIADWQL